VKRPVSNYHVLAVVVKSQFEDAPLSLLVLFCSIPTNIPTIVVRPGPDAPIQNGRTILGPLPRRCSAHGAMDGRVDKLQPEKTMAAELAG